MLKRSWLSIQRKLSRTIILIVIFFVMANLMLATIAIQRAVAESTTYAKASLGGMVYLQPDMEKVREQAMQNAQQQNGGMGIRVSFRPPNIPLETVQDIANSQYVKDLTYSLSSSANAVSFQLVQTEEQQLRAEGSLRVGGPMGRGDTAISGINAFDFIAEVEAGTMSISDGEAFDESTVSGAIISYDLADTNNLKVGDQITLATTADTPTEITLTLVGIYDSTTELRNPNIIYTNVETATQFLLEEDLENGSYGVNNVKFFLTSTEHKDAFLAEANAKYPNLADDNLTLNTDTAAYEQMAGPIEGVGNFSAVMLLIVIVASVATVSLIVTISIKDRRYEMGVLMSLGATKKNILGQNLTELLIVGTAAFALSIMPSAFLARAMGNGLLEQQIASSQQNQTGLPSRGMMGGGMTTVQGGNFIGAPINITGGGPIRSDVQAIDEIDVNPDAGDYLILFLAGYGIIIFALILPTTNILRFQPKIILTGKE